MINRLLKIEGVAVACLILFSTISVVGSAAEITEESPLIGPPTLPQPQKDWTVAYYLAGDNDLEEYMIDDINEMELVGSDSSNLNIVAMLDMSDDYDTSNGDWTDTRRFYITYDSIGAGDPNDRTIRSWGESIGEVNTGNPSTLTSFFGWV